MFDWRIALHGIPDRPSLLLKDPARRPVEIVILTRPHCPEESGKTSGAQEKSDRDQNHEAVHAVTSTGSASTEVAGPSSALPTAIGRRSALAVTMIEEVDMAMAAIIGVA